MASLVHTITAITAALYGVNILEETPAGDIQGTSTNVVASVADLPWGPEDTVTLITSPAELFDTFAPTAFGRLEQSFPALLAYINKTFPASMKIVRVAATGSASATFAFQDNDPAVSVNVTAKHPGALGNQIKVAWTVNAETAANRDATVSIGTAYSVTYPNVATPAGGLTVVDPGDPFVDFVADVAGDEVPDAIAATALAGGLDGTAVIGDYLGTVGVGRGLEEYADANVDADVIFGAEIPQALVAAWNAGLKAWMVANKRAFGVLSTDSAITTVAAAIADVPTYRSDRLMYPWPRVKTVNTFDPLRAETVVDGNAFAAVAIGSVPPEVSPGGAPGSAFLKGISGLEITGGLNTNAYKSLNDAGIAPWFNSTALEGFIIHRGFTTSIQAALRRIFRRRMTDFIMTSIGDASEVFGGTLLDLDLPNKALGDNTAVQKGRWDEFLGDLVTNNRIRGYTIDAFSANTQANIDAGQWRVVIAVKLISAQEELVFLANIGETVDLETV